MGPIAQADEGEVLPSKMRIPSKELINHAERGDDDGGGVDGAGALVDFARNEMAQRRR